MSVPDRQVPAWPLLLLAAPAFVAIWSGWVGLGELTGFGVVRPLPGIWPSLELNTAITLPIGVEAYAAYALKAWLTPGVPDRARRFARASAIGALVLGALGQVAYHLMVAAEVRTAPWQIITLVSCLPVAVLGMGAALVHLLRTEDHIEVPPTPAPVIVYDLPETPAPDLPEQVEQTGLEVAEEPARTDVSDRSDAPGQTGLIQPEQTDPDRSDISSRTDSSDRSADRSGRSQQTGPKRGKQTGPARKQRTDAELSEAAQQMAEQNGTSPTRYQLKQALGIGSERAARVLAELDYVPADDHTSNGVVTPTEDFR